MFVLPECFAMLTYAGVWQPVTWKISSYKAYFYKFYTLVAIILIYTLTISELMGALLLTDNLQDFTDISFLLISTVSICCKVASLILRRQRVIGLAEMLVEKQCLPKNAEELEITCKFDRIARLTALSCIVLGGTTVVVMTMGPLFQPRENRTLPFKSWLPYELSSDSRFWFSYVHQTLAIYACATINVANDSLICGFMLQACSQLELLNRRLCRIPEVLRSMVNEKMPKSCTRDVETRVIAPHIRHHVHIFNYTENIKRIFTPVILLQFCMSSIVLCVSVYQLSMNSSNGIQMITTFMYLCCMMVEIFMYCWFGNEVTLKSIEFGQALYEIDWTVLPIQTSRNILFMMIRARRPIVMSCGYLVTLSIQSFTTIVKASYSVFNVLQQSADD